MKLEAQVWEGIADESHMAKQSQKVEITASLKSVHKRSDGKYLFRVVSRAGVAGSGYKPGATPYHFLLTKEKALKIANQDSEFPTGINLRLRVRVSPVNPDVLTFVKIIAVDGHDVQSWAEKNQSPTVAPDVLTKAQRSIDEAEEENMRRRAPPDPAPLFKTPKEAFERAMYLLRRQVRLKNPKLSKSDIWAIRDALNMLKEKAGL